MTTLIDKQILLAGATTSLDPNVPVLLDGSRPDGTLLDVSQIKYNGFTIWTESPSSIQIGSLVTWDTRYANSFNLNSDGQSVLATGVDELSLVPIYLYELGQTAFSPTSIDLEPSEFNQQNVSVTVTAKYADGTSKILPSFTLSSSTSLKTYPLNNIDGVSVGNVVQLEITSSDAIRFDNFTYSTGPTGITSVSVPHILQ